MLTATKNARLWWFMYALNGNKYQACDGFRIQIRRNPAFFSKIRRYLTPDRVKLETFVLVHLYNYFRK